MIKFDDFYQNLLKSKQDPFGFFKFYNFFKKNNQKLKIPSLVASLVLKIYSLNIKYGWYR